MSRCATKFREKALDVTERETLIDLERLAKRLAWQSEQIFYAVAYCKRNNTTEGLSEMVAYSFNAQQHTPQYGGAGGLPPGKYKGVIVNSYTDNTEKNGVVTGGYLAFDLTPIEGPLAGQKQTDRLNLHHTNPKVVEIANKQLSAYCHVLNKFQFNDTAELHNIPFMFEVGLQKEPNPNGYVEIKAIFDINGNEPGKAGAGPQVQQQQQQPVTPPAGGVQAQGSWGGQQGQGGQPPIDNNVQQPNQNNAGWGGGQPEQNQGQQGNAGWGGAPANQGQPQGGNPGWGGQQQQPSGNAGWGGAPAGGPGAWGQR